MRVDGRYEFRAGRQEVWKALQDPQTLAETLPGVRRLEVVGPDKFAVVADVGVGSVRGVFDGTFEINDKKDFESCVLRGSARGPAGSVTADVTTRLSDADGGTLLEFGADAKVTGAMAGVGQRMIAAASKRMAGEFFGAIDRSILGAPETEERVPSAGAPEVGRVFERPPAAAGENRGFLLGLFVGFALAVIGIAIGRRTARGHR
jgi:carbon monoxide dehydrogenase subunit G